MPNSYSAHSFLRNRRTFLTNTVYSRVKIRPSLSSTELEARKKLIEECRGKNSEIGKDEEAKDPFVVYANLVMRRSEIDDWKRTNKNTNQH
jgi:hypothetical protein